MKALPNNWFRRL